jgi:hypothetical protein
MFLLDVERPSIEAPILKESPNIELDLETLRLSLKSSFDIWVLLLVETIDLIAYLLNVYE